jgi:hypothetical protein
MAMGWARFLQRLSHRAHFSSIHRWRFQETETPMPEPEPEYEEIKALALKIAERDVPRTPWQRRRAHIWSVLNATFTIWVLTAIVGTAVAYTYANLQTCFKDAGDKVTQYNHLTTEIRNRVLYILDAVSRAKTVSALKASLAALPVTRSEYKDVSLTSLNSDLWDLQVRYIRPIEAQPLATASALEASKLNSDDADMLPILSGRLKSDFSEADLARLKTALPKLSTLTNGVLGFQTNYMASVSCTMSGAFASLFGGRSFMMEYVRVSSPRGGEYTLPPPPSKDSQK